jgi:Bacterial transcriptional activator domain
VGAATDAEVVIELEPFRETSHALLLEAHAAAGNTAQALAA